MKSEKYKSLIINEILYADYLIEGEVMYLKTRKYFNDKDKMKSENLIIELITSIEKKKIPYVAYLNIK